MFKKLKNPKKILISFSLCLIGAILVLSSFANAQVVDPGTGTVFPIVPGPGGVMPTGAYADYLNNQKVSETKSLSFIEAWIMYLFAMFFWLFAKIAEMLKDLGISLVQWVISPGFLEMQLTNPGTNPIVAIGLGYTRGLINMVLALVLVFIGLATMLRLENYRTKKTLYTFIVIALLINFAPVICGLIVDASNITMDYFLFQKSGIIEQQSACYYYQGRPIYSLPDCLSYEMWSNWNYETFKTGIIQLFVLIFVYLISFFIYLLFAAIFLLRYFAIMILVILSPIAFALYILPNTRQYWNTWWTQFVQWATIGITCAFFFSMANYFINIWPNINSSSPDINFGSTAVVGFKARIISYFVSLAFLGLGLVFGLKTSAIGSGAIIDSFKRRGKQAAGWAGGKAAGAAGKYAAGKVKQLVPAAVRKAATGMATAGKWGQNQTGIGGWAKRTVSTPFVALGRAIATPLGPGLTESQREQIKKTQESIKGKTAETQLSAYRKAKIETDKVGILNQIIEDGNFNDFVKKGNITDAEIKKIRETAKKWQSNKVIDKAIPHMLEGADMMETIKKMKPADYEKISSQAIESTEVMDAILINATSKHIDKLIENLGKNAASKIEERINTGANISPTLKNYFSSQAGQSMFTIKPEILQRWKEEKEKGVISRIILPPGVEIEKKQTQPPAKSKPKKLRDLFKK
ncbi:MAG: hypothetical protein PHI53_02550 [Candidatus Pacebacteria bacterium]|nr:hypothetical protein [Candidatus Paceibacterota bacterium]